MGRLVRSCSGEVSVNKCEGMCSSQVRPSISAPTGFSKVTLAVISISKWMSTLAIDFAPTPLVNIMEWSLQYAFLFRNVSAAEKISYVSVWWLWIIVTIPMVLGLKTKTVLSWKCDSENPTTANATNVEISAVNY